MFKEKLILFGTGTDADKFYNEFNGLVEIVFCLENNIDKHSDKYNNIPIYNLDSIDINLKKYKIIIATEWYHEVKEKLNKRGLVEFENFIYYKLFHKKIAIVHGNCHISIIKKLLESSTHFYQTYGLYPLPGIHRIKDGFITDMALSKCDLFIHQDIQTNNKYGYKVSDEYILPRLKENCIKICIPNLFGLGYGFFPQTSKTSNSYNKCIEEDNNGMFPHQDLNINELIKDHNVNQIITESKGMVYDNVAIIENFNTYIEKIRFRENNWDIKILEFILNNYRKEKLFYDVGHPTNIILTYICNNVLKLLGFEDEVSEIDFCLDTHENPIYPCVKKALRLQFNDLYIRKNSRKKLRNVNMDFDEYIREYCEWCFDKII